MLFSMRWPRYYCHLVLQEKENTRGTSTALSESDISFWKAFLNMNKRKYPACLSVFFLLYPPLAGCHRITARDFVFFSGCFSEFPSDMSHNSILSQWRARKWTKRALEINPGSNHEIDQITMHLIQDELMILLTKS